MATAPVVFVVPRLTPTLLPAPDVWPIRVRLAPVLAVNETPAPSTTLTPANPGFVELKPEIVSAPLVAVKLEASPMRKPSRLPPVVTLPVIEVTPEEVTELW